MNVAGVQPREKAEWTIDMGPTVAEQAQTLKITAINESGQGAVKLVDWRK